MELRHLTAFAEVTEQGSFTRAAAALSLTQSAVSQHVAALEREFEQPLLVRSPGNVTPTESGSRLYEYVRQILDLIHEARRELQGEEEPTISGTLKLAVSTVPAETLLPEILAQFRSAYPHVCERITVADSRAAIAAIESGAADIGIVGEFPQSSKLTATPIGSDELLLVAAPAFLPADKKSLSLKQLRSIPLIIRESGSGSRRCLEQTFESIGMQLTDLTIVMEVNSNEAIRAAVIRGLGASFLSQALVSEDIARNRLHSVDVRGVRFERKIYLLQSTGRVPDAMLRAFLNLPGLKNW